MFLLLKPGSATLNRLLARYSDSPHSYAEVGATQGTPPAGYQVDHNRKKIGSGEPCWQEARSRVRQWAMFDLGWVWSWPPNAPMAVGTMIAVVSRHFGFYSVNISRVLYVVDKTDRFGFAYGTTRAHVECGEERFLVERDADGSVWYDIFAFSRPRHILVRMGNPLARMLQKRFAQDSLRRFSS